MVHAISSILIGHPERALKDLANPAIGNGSIPSCGRALPSRGRKNGRTRAKSSRTPNSRSPRCRWNCSARHGGCDAGRAQVKDYAGASRRRSELDVIGIPGEMKPEMAVLRGRLAEALGHDKDAIDAYRFAAYSSDREASAEARLLGALLRHKRGELGQAELLRELETLSAIWRGDAIELKTLKQDGADLRR